MTIPLVFPSPELWAEEENPEMYREECGKGVTIYCIASGMAEEKADNLEEALGYYRFPYWHPLKKPYLKDKKQKDTMQKNKKRKYNKKLLRISKLLRHF